VALAAHCNSKSTIYGVSRLQTKESNRAQTLVEEFAKIGIKISISEDKMVVNPSKIKLNTVNSHNDHRIAMALAVTSLCSKSGIDIEGFECINKSYPEFYNDLKKITQQE
jgi:3-phosphoshikimate 1-carboxyvinyltransferase